MFWQLVNVQNHKFIAQTGRHRQFFISLEPDKHAHTTAVQFEFKYVQQMEHSGALNKHVIDMLLQNKPQ